MGLWQDKWQGDIGNKICIYIIILFFNKNVGVNKNKIMLLTMIVSI